MTLYNKISDFLKIEFIILKKIKINISNSFFFRILFVIILNIIYYIFQWEHLRAILGNLIAWLFTNWAGMPTTFNFPGFKGSLENITWISRDCLYIDIFAYTLPFLFDRKKTIIKNIFIALLFITIIQLINIFRIYFSVLSFTQLKISWFIAHDIPDALLWYPIVIGTMLFGALKFELKSIIIEKIKKENPITESK
jgi:exosortase/archaeosortase family protein